MSDQIFYAAAQDRGDDSKINGYVPSKFLMRNGTYVVDPIPGASQNAYLYSDGSGSNKTNGKMANPNNYIVVPANHSEEEARDFAAALATVSKIGVGPTLAMMTSAFWPGGSQELQRNPRWGFHRIPSCQPTSAPHPIISGIQRPRRACPGRWRPS